MITDRPLVNSARALLLATEVARHAVVFFLFFFTPYSRSYFSHPNFTSCKLQNTHKVPTDTGHWQVRCSPIDSGIHTMLNRPGTRSNRLGPDPDPADHLKYRPEPERVPGRVPGPRVLCEDL